MFAASSLFVILTLSVIIIRVAAVALRMTGMPDQIARFQARSAFTGTGFTTSESEAILGHPVRRRIVSLLMIVGNLGLVTIMATVIVSLSDSLRSEGAFFAQLLWMAGVLLLLWFIAFNPVADRWMCNVIGRLLRRTQWLTVGASEQLLQCPGGHGVHLIRVAADRAPATVADLVPATATVLGIHRIGEAYRSSPAADAAVRPLDEIYVYGPDAASASADTPLDDQG